jgi:hypothetical protein
VCITLRSAALRPAASTLHPAPPYTRLLLLHLQPQLVLLRCQLFTHRGLDHIRREAEGLLERLEEHYYVSAHKGPLLQPPQQDPAAATLAELCAQAQAMIDDMHVQ